MDINRLKKDRENIRTRIRIFITKDKPVNDIKKLVIKYNEITDTLAKSGIKTTIQSPHLIPSYWDNHTTDDYNKMIKAGHLKFRDIISKVNQPPEIVERVVEKVKFIKEYNYYILCIAWDKTESNNFNLSDVNEIITPYLIHMGGEYISEDFNEMWDRIEYIIKYKFAGSSDLINTIKNSVEYIAKTNNINLEIYYKINKSKQ